MRSRPKKVKQATMGSKIVGLPFISASLFLKIRIAFVIDTLHTHDILNWFFIDYFEVI